MVLKSKTLTVTVCIASFKMINKLQRERLRQSHAIAFNWNDGHIDKRRTFCLYRSFIIIHTGRGQWQAFFTWEMTMCLAEVSVMDRFPKLPGETEHVQTVCSFFSLPKHKSKVSGILGHTKLISCFWSTYGSIFSELLDLCNQM